MVDKVTEEQRQLAVRIASEISDEQRQAVRDWIDRMMAIRNGDSTASVQVKEAVSATTDTSILWPIISVAGQEIKRMAWDDRGVLGRFGVGAALGLMMFGPQGAGIAAFGSAIGVPLWVLFGTGGVVLSAVYDELSKSKASDKGGESNGDEKKYLMNDKCPLLFVPCLKDGLVVYA